MILKRSTTSTHHLKHSLVTKKKLGNSIFLPKVGRFSWINFLHDPVFDSYLFQRFITHFMKDGKRTRTQKIFYRLFGSGANENKLRLEYFFQIIEKLRPSFILVPTRRGKIINRVPMAMSPAKAYRKAMRFFVVAVKDRREGLTLEAKIYSEFYDTLFTPGYFNKYAEAEFKLVVENAHLKHFRRFGVM